MGGAVGAHGTGEGEYFAVGETDGKTLASGREKAPCCFHLRDGLLIFVKIFEIVRKKHGTPGIVAAREEAGAELVRMVERVPEDYGALAFIYRSVREGEDVQPSVVAAGLIRDGLLYAEEDICGDYAAVGALGDGVLAETLVKVMEKDRRIASVIREAVRRLDASTAPYAAFSARHAIKS